MDVGLFILRGCQTTHLKSTRRDKSLHILYNRFRLQAFPARQSSSTTIFTFESCTRLILDIALVAASFGIEGWGCINPVGLCIALHAFFLQQKPTLSFLRQSDTGLAA